MSTQLKPGIQVTIDQISGEAAPKPLPLECGFTADQPYEVLGVHCPEGIENPYLLLANDDNELWCISNRHLRVSKKALHEEVRPSRRTSRPWSGI